MNLGMLIHFPELLFFYGKTYVIANNVWFEETIKSEYTYKDPSILPNR